MKNTVDAIRHGFGPGVFVFALGAVLAGSAAAEDVEAGRALFEDRCQECHGVRGDGNGPAAEDMYLKPRDFAMAAFKFDTDADWERGTDVDLANVIRNGAGTYGGSPVMPAWSDLTEGEVAALIAFIRSLAG